MTTPLLPPEHLQWHPAHWLEKPGIPLVMLWEPSLCFWLMPGRSEEYTPEQIAHFGYRYLAPAYPPTEEEAAKLREAP